MVVSIFTRQQEQEQAGERAAMARQSAVQSQQAVLEGAQCSSRADGVRETDAARSPASTWTSASARPPHSKRLCRPASVQRVLQVAK